MNPAKAVFAAVGTASLLGLAMVMHATGQLGGSAKSTVDANLDAEAIALHQSNFDDVATQGKEADAIYGDVVLRNGLVSAVIAQSLGNRHANMTVKDVAGGLIDFSVRSASGGDQLAAYYPGKKVYPYRSISMRDSRGNVLGPNEAGPRGEASAVVVQAEGTDARAEATVTYSLHKKSPYLTVTTTFANRAGKPLKIELEDDFRIDGPKGDILRSPNGTFSRFWIYDPYWGQAYGLDADGYKLQLTSDARTTTIKYENPAGETAVSLAPGETFQFTRRLYPGATIFDVHALAGKPSEIGQVTFSTGSGSMDGNTSIELSQGDNVIGTARLDKFNNLTTSLPAGDYTAKLYFCGIAAGSGEPIRIAPGQNNIPLKMDVPRGRVLGTVTDAAGGRIPCKVEFTPQAEGVKLHFGPETADFSVRNLVYTHTGQFDQTIPAGKYNVTISHGPEFDIVRTEVDVKAGGQVPLQAKLVRSVETPGWVSGDFHSHASPSGDNVTSQLGRVLNLVCEHVEFAPCTEHNRVSTYEPHIKALGIEAFFKSVPGIELTNTPLPLSHQNAFPMKLTPRTQDNGGPTAGPDLESQIERLALWDNRSEKLLQVNHPDVGWMFYDKDGDGKPDAGYERAFPFMDVMEVHPIEDALHLGPTSTYAKVARNNTMFNWLQLLNQGFRIYGVVNTDAHYNFHGSGPLRNWIQSSTDDPAKIDHMEMVHAAEQGRLTMSNGPYLEVLASETGNSNQVVSGQDLKANGGKVSLNVRVQCPNWLDINKVVVLVNGRPHTVHSYTREKNPDAFRSGVVKFDRSLDLELKQDAHLVVIAGQVGGSLTAVYGPEYGKPEPTALSNPIFVDIDGNGFQPNKDTLDAPLPVKHPNSKP